ncbi:MAG TPA: TetR/AcrR family transcriptional regulator [Chryseolinea sp.]
MENVKKSRLWVDVGYSLFAEEGMEGLQIERLARILQLNKSGFYHHFGDFEGYLVEVLKSHQEKAADFMRKLQKIKTLDPDYFLLLMEFAIPVMFQVHASRCSQTHPTVYRLGVLVDETVNAPIGKLFGDFIGIENRPDLAGKYYVLVRDMFYARATLQNITYEFLLNLHTEAKLLLIQIVNNSIVSNQYSPTTNTF